MGRKRTSIIVAILLTLLICSTLIYQSPYRPFLPKEAAALSWGSEGDKVVEMQRKLKQWGYYDGAVDGVFAGQTFEAVKRFQANNSLTPDGIVGDATAAALGITLGTTAPATGYQPSRGGDSGARGEVYLMACAVHGEARGEPYVGKVAVAAVILNRVKSPLFPNSIAGVIYQPGAFTAVDDGQINLAPDEESVRAARDAMNGWDPTGGAIYYFNPATATSSWIWSRPVHIVIGKHHFGT